MTQVRKEATLSKLILVKDICRVIKLFFKEKENTVLKWMILFSSFSL